VLLFTSHRQQQHRREFPKGAFSGYVGQVPPPGGLAPHKSTVRADEEQALARERPSGEN